MFNGKTVVIFGGAGFVGSNLAVFLKNDFPQMNVICVDNLKRRGSELAIPRLQDKKIVFLHGDIRNREDIDIFEKIDCIIDCSAEPSVLAEYTSSPVYVINTNLLGTINCLEIARKHKAKFIFLSTSRVYPSKAIESLELEETDTRFELKRQQKLFGVSEKGISECFTISGARSLYGATKLACELMITEYVETFGLEAVINRCGVIAGPWQMGKTDQGLVCLWAARHYFKERLNYIGYGGKGKQVRDILHIHDLYRLIRMQMQDMKKFSGKTYNVGGGRNSSVSLLELTKLCEHHTGNKIEITSVMKNRPNDIPVYLSDTSKIEAESGWKPLFRPAQIVEETVAWIRDNEKILRSILTEK